MTNKFSPGDWVLYNDKKYIILERHRFAIGIAPTGHEILETSDDQFTLIDPEGNKEFEVYADQLEKAEE